MTMATSSITKHFTIKDEKTCEVLAKALSKPTKRRKTTSFKYEEGKKKLEQYFGR